MKKLFVIVPAVAIVFFLINAFVLNENAASAKTTKSDNPSQALIVFKSIDGGQTWLDISKGLPQPMKDQYDTNKNVFFADAKGLHVTVGKEVYHSNTSATTPFWTKAISPDLPNSVTASKSGSFSYKYWGINLKKTDGTNVWSPIFENFQEPRIRSVFETTAGVIFVGTNNGLYKTANNGKTWKQVFTGGLVGNLAELNGVLLGTSMRKIIRSTDNGENWAVVNGVSSVVFDVKQIKGGFAAIYASTESNTRKLSRSFDDGKTWQPIETGLQNKVVNDSIWRTWNNRLRLKASIAFMIQVGENFFCTHSEGIFKSSDKGKTWILLRPSLKDRVYHLMASGNVIYAIASKDGC